MNKYVVDREMGFAYDELKKSEISYDGKIKKAFRGQVATFGAAVSMGSILSAVAFFSNDGSASVERSQLLSVIYNVLADDGIIDRSSCSDLFAYARSGKRDVKENITNAAIAVKLAMNLFELV